MSKTKRLLSVTLAIAMIILSAFSAFAEETEIEVETLSGTVTAEDVTVEPGVTEVEVPVTIAFENDNQVSPHGQFDIAAEGATLESATFKKSDNANFTPDETVPDGAGLVDKSIYVDADGVNTENGRVIVESDVSEGKQPSVSYVTVEVVLEFTVALTEGQVITVDISNIAATNLSEASWDGMVDVDGTITVEVDEPECDHANAVTKFDATQHWAECDCGETWEKAEHDFSEEVIKEADVGVDGLKRYTCECGYVYDDRIEKTSSNLGGTLNESYTSGDTTIEGNIASVLDNRYSFTFDIRNTDFLTRAKELGSANSEFGFAAEIGGSTYYFSKQTSTYNRYTVADLSFGQFDSEIKIYMYLKDISTGTIYASDSFTVVPGDAISERSDNDSALKTAYHDFKDAWALAYAA